MPAVLDFSMPASRLPRLTMLWESGDPDEALLGRFGFDGVGDATAWLTRTLAHSWEIEISSCARITMSDGNALAWLATSSGPMVAKWGVAPERFPRLSALAGLTTWLDEQHLPVSRPVPTPDGRVQLQIDGVSLGLQREIAGRPLETSSPRQVRAAGVALCRLHDALDTYPEVHRFPAPVLASGPLRARIEAWLEAAPRHLPPDGRDALRSLLDDAPSEGLPVQLVHGDFRSANVLCDGHDVVAVIDFEETRFDHRVVEVARSAVLLGTRFHDWGPVSAEVRSQFLDGYQSVRPFTADESAWWPILVLWASLTMVPAGEDRTGWGLAARDYVDVLQLRK